MKSSAVKIRISIAAKGKGNVANIERKYTMQEHNDELYIKDGQNYALSELGLDKSEIVVQDWPIIDDTLEAEIQRLYGSGDQVVEGQMAIPKVHNPMQSCFRSYRTISILGSMVLIKPVSAGIVYAISNQEWIDEFKAA